MIPGNSPIVVPAAYCQGGCKNVMRVEVTYTLKGIIQKVEYFCDTCKYGREVSPQYATGVDVKYREPRPPGLVSAAPPKPQAPAPQPVTAPPLPSGPVRAEAEPVPDNPQPTAEELAAAMLAAENAGS